MRVAAVVSDLMLFSRIESAASAAAAELVRVDSPSELAGSYDLVLVDWSARQPGWSESLRRLEAGRLVLFGPHVDLEAHAAAKEAGLGPMMARSKVVATLDRLVAGTTSPQRS